MAEDMDRVGTVKFALRMKEDHEEMVNSWIESLRPFKHKNLDDLGLWLLGSPLHTVNSEENVIIDEFQDHLATCLKKDSPKASAGVIRGRISKVKELLAHKLAWPKILQYREGVPSSEIVSVLKNSDNSLTVGDLKKLSMEEIRSLGVSKTEMNILWRLFLLDTGPQK